MLTIVTRSWLVEEYNLLSREGSSNKSCNKVFLVALPYFRYQIDETGGVIIVVQIYYFVGNMFLLKL